LLDYDALCADPGAGLERLAQFIQVEPQGALLAQAARIPTPSPHDIDGALFDDKLVEEATALHARLAALSLV
jgi:hypothetical protein